MIVTFMGHGKKHYSQKVADTLIDVLENKVDGRDVTFYMGLDGRFDWLAKNCCLKYKEKYGNAKVIFVTPYLDGKYLRNLRFAIEGFDEVIYPDIERVPKRYAIAARNRYMIDQSDFVVAYVCSLFGNARNFLDYAAVKRKEVINLDYLI